jgi:hypothetical protein
MARLAKPTRQGVVFGTPFLLLAVGLYLWLAERSVLHCEHQAGAALCRLDSVRTLTSHSQSFPPDSLRGAELDETTHYDPDDHTTTTSYRIVLLTSTGKRPMSLSSTNGQSRSATAENVRLINDFLKTPQQATLEIGQDNRLFIFFCVVLLGILGVWIMFNAGY